MSHRTILKKNLTASESKPLSTDSDIAKHPSDLTQPYKPSFIVKHLSSLNLSNSHRPKHKQQQQQQQSQAKHKHKHKHPPPLLVDTRLQARAMTTSAIVEPSKYSLLKPNPEKERTTIKRGSREKPRSKVQGLLKNENKDFHNKRMVEDVKIEKSHDDDDDVIKRSSVSMVPSGGGRRRSLSGSQVDLRDVFAINGAKMVSADMPPFMQIHAVDCARKAFDSMEKFTSKTLALSLKKEFDGVYGPAWHCIVGTSFGSFVTHSGGGFLYFSMDQKLYILLFKTAVQKAD